ncbi:hypothetical protein M413DRAFT_445911 [Hebeloma cylindrosporum]|uniref:Uncharacterized protein n=1 Tax=Hebeloma cylindrosporum TaxID=76867 RepID=A0A0C2XRU7_HEBCY|nr:hypothetical protein M413DRAFT_445911 [Hebeloma cylindrosporum h7]
MLFLFLLASFLCFCNAQTVTTTNDAGQSIIQVITVSGAVTTTQVIQTLSAASPSTTSQAPVSTQTLQQGPVGQPGSTTGTPGAPIPYAYTTVIGGVTTVVQDIFTPTSPATTTVFASGSGTILDYSSWRSVYGPPSGVSNSGHSMKNIPYGVFTGLAAAACGNWIL